MGICLDIFSLIYHFSFLSPSLWETARNRLKFCLKGPLNPKQPTKEELTRTLQNQWLGFVRSESLRDKEVKLCNMPDLERCFETNIIVYSRHADKSVSVIY